MILCSDPGKQATKYQKEIKKVINRVLSSNSNILGQELYELEKEVKDNPSEEAKKALEWEVHELSKAIHIIVKCVTSSIEENE